MKYSFPEGFLWGSATSGPQTEGAASVDGKAPTVWDAWHAEESTTFHNEVGPVHASNFYYTYKEDIKRMKAINHNSFRTSIAWARLLPDGENINPKAVAFYNDVIDEMIANDIEPIMNLYHFDMPLHFHERGGWENREVVEAFAFYAKTAFELFGDRVKTWATFNEPIVPVEAGYLGPWHLPRVNDFKRAVCVAYHTMLASAKAIQNYRATKQDGRIGIILNLSPAYPRSRSKADVEASELADLLGNRSFLDPSVKGAYPEKLVNFLKQYDLLPTVEQGDKEIIAENTVDYLGVNYYQPRRIQAKDEPVEVKAPYLPSMFFDAYVWPERKMNPHRGWEIYERGLYDIAIQIRDEYDNIPWFVSENGMGVEGEEKFLDEFGVVQDDYRIEFIKDHLRYLHQGISEGSNCFGYHLWTFMDNWSWCNAYKNRYGFYRVDIENNWERTLKKSGVWITEVSANNAFSDEE